MGSTDIATSKYKILILTLVPRFAVLQKHIGPLSCELADQTNLWLFIFFPKRFFCSITNTLYLVQSVESLCNHMYTYIFIIRTCVCCTLYIIISYFQLSLVMKILDVPLPSINQRRLNIIALMCLQGIAIGKMKRFLLSFTVFCLW